MCVPLGRSVTIMEELRCLIRIEAAVSAPYASFAGLDEHQHANPQASKPSTEMNGSLEVLIAQLSGRMIWIHSRT